MINKKRTIPLAAKVIGGIAFLTVFALNLTMFVQKDVKTGDVSLASLKAYAQESGGEPGFYNQYILTNQQCYGGYIGNFYWDTSYYGCPGSSTMVGENRCYAPHPGITYTGYWVECVVGGEEECVPDYCLPDYSDVANE